MDRLGRGDSSADLAPARAHLVGVTGGGMSGLAQMLVQRGVEVTGSERTGGPAVERLRRLGVRVHTGHAPHRCFRGVEFLIYRPGTARDHPERLAAARRGIAQGSSVDWLGRLLGSGLGLAVVGQREAGAASAMIAWTLTRAGLDPSVLLSNAVPQLGGWARIGSGPHSVIEALDLDEGLRPLAPRMAVVLDVGMGPPETALETRTAVLRRLLASVPHDGVILALGPNAALEAAVLGLAPAVEWLSLEQCQYWWGADLREDRGRYRFRVFRRGRFVVEIRLQVPGRRNVVSALAAVAACHRLDVPVVAIKEGLEEFSGLSRDFEPRGSYRGVTLVDDAGRDASGVAEALALSRKVFGSRRVCAVLGAEGGEAAPDDGERYLSAFSAADYILITDGDTVTGRRLGGPSLAETLVAGGARARWLARLEDVVSELDRYLEPGDVLVTLGAGAVGTIADAFIRRLRRDRQGQ